MASRHGELGDRLTEFSPCSYKSVLSYGTFLNTGKGCHNGPHSLLFTGTNARFNYFNYAGSGLFS